jgi:hypothetical protein
MMTKSSAYLTNWPRWRQRSSQNRSSSWSTTFASNGEITPPTIWQTPLFRARHKRVRRHAKDDADLRLVDLNARHERADQVPTGVPVGSIELLGDLTGELFQATDQQPEILVRRGVVGELSSLLLKTGEALPQARDPWLKLLLVDEAFGVAVDQPGHPLTDLRALGLHGGEVGHCRVWRWHLQATAILLLESLRLLQQAAHLLPDGGLQTIGPYLGVGADPLAAEAVGIRSQAPIVRIPARAAMGLGPADRLAVERVATPGAHDQTLQEVPSTPLPLPRMLAIFGQLVLHGREQDRVDQWWDRDRQPVTGRDVGRRNRPSRLQRPASLRPEAGLQRPRPGLAETRRADVGRVLQHGPDGGAVPDGLAGARPLAGLGESTPDLADRGALLPDPVEDLADHARLLEDDLVAGGPATLVLADVAVAIWRPRQDAHDAGLRAMPFATAAPLQDLGSFILGHHALHLEQQIVLRRATQLAIQEHDLDPGRRQLVQQQHLVGILPGEPIRRVNVHAIHPAGRRQVTQPLQRRSHQRRATVPIVDERQVVHERHPIGHHPGSQGCYLARDGPGFSLLLGRDPGIDRRLQIAHGLVSCRARLGVSRPLGRESIRSASTTGSSQCGHGPPGPTRRQKTWHSGQRCSPKRRTPQLGHS